MPCQSLSMEGIRQLLRLRIRDTLGIHGDGLHHLGLFGLVGHHVPGLGDDLVHHVHAVDDHTEGGILPVQMGRVLVHDENWLPAESISWARAILSTPRVWRRSLGTPLAANSPLMQ